MFEETTTAMLEKELNRWLKMKWSHADFNRELPTQEDLTAYMKKEFDKIADFFATSVLKQDRAYRKENGLMQKDLNPDFYMLTMMDIRSLGAPANTLSLGAWRGTEFHPLVTYHLDIRHMEQDGDKQNAVKSVTCDLPDTPLLDIISEEARQQTEAQPNLSERWLNASEQFREKHPICPACGGPVRLESRCSDRAVHAFCECCSWESQYPQYYYLSDCCDKKKFEKELRFLGRLDRFRQALGEAKAEAQEAVNRFIKAQGLCPSGDYLFELMEAIQSHVKSMEQVQEGARQKKK